MVNIFKSMLKSARQNNGNPVSTQPPPSALPVQGGIQKPVSTRPPTSSSYKFHEQNLNSRHTRAASVERPSEMGGGGGSRRRSSSHRMRKSYRKSKPVRHTLRKQTRRHKNRRSHHRR